MENLTKNLQNAIKKRVFGGFLRFFQHTCIWARCKSYSYLNNHKMIKLRFFSNITSKSRTFHEIFKKLTQKIIFEEIFFEIFDFLPHMELMNTFQETKIL